MGGNDISSIAAQLLATRYNATDIPLLAGIGVYAFFVKNTAELLPVKVEENGLLYVGMTEDSLDVRNHFTQHKSGFSTLRRSLGAILKHRLELKAVARGNASSISNIRQYNFTPEGESRLSEWMREHLLYSYHLSDDMCMLEKGLIRIMEPPLCLIGWKNPQNKMIRLMRKTCADEAWELARSDAE